ncbi:hypothetical protein LINPERPRIM_LOCUS28687 [Linum perenne]
MAYRRRAQPSPSPSSFHYSYDNLRDDRKASKADEEEEEAGGTLPRDSTSIELAAKAIRASSAAKTTRDSSLSSAYYAFPPSPSSAPASKAHDPSQSPHAYTSMNSIKQSNPDPKPGGFWGTLARKAKSFLDDDGDEDQRDHQQFPQHQYREDRDFAPKPHQHQQQQHHSPPPPPGPPTSLPKNDARPASVNESRRKKELRKGLNAISSSLNYIGNAVEEGLSKVENRTADIIQETRKHIRKKPGGTSVPKQTTNQSTSRQQPQVPPQVQPQTRADLELQLKASRDVAMAMAAKAKLLLRELKSVKADLTFSKERCAQLEEENKVLRENRERGGNLEDDDMIRLQLETLLAEKARLAHENSVFARENRFLREVVEYHQLTMQDVVYLDEGTEEVKEVYPIKVVTNTSSSTPANGLAETLVHPVPPPELGLEIEDEVPRNASHQIHMTPS